LAHGAVLRSTSFTAEQVAAVVAGDYTAARLSPAETAIAAFAEQVVLRADEVTRAEVDALRRHGLDDAAVFDVVLAATARIFWSRANDAIGYEPSQSFLPRIRALFEEELVRQLMVGRQFQSAEADR
jgi:alkylhydroperoxidase family enzyme